MSTRENLLIYEFTEFSQFSAREQRYIKRSLTVAFKPETAIDTYARSESERLSILAQTALYAELQKLKEVTQKPFGFSAIQEVLQLLVPISNYDLKSDSLHNFSSYRYLYERLLSARIRPWLPSSFLAAAALPNIKPPLRNTLLKSLSEKAALAEEWSTIEPTIFPKWIEEKEA